MNNDHGVKPLEFPLSEFPRIAISGEIKHQILKRNGKNCLSDMLDSTLGHLVAKNDQDIKESSSIYSGEKNITQGVFFSQKINHSVRTINDLLFAFVMTNAFT